MESIKNMVLTKPGEYLENVKSELIDLRARYLVNKENHDRLSSLKDFFQREMIRSNPRMTSVEYREFLEELKEKVTRKRKTAETQETAEEQETTESKTAKQKAE